MTPTPTPELANATSSLTNSVGSAWGMAPIVGLVLIAVLGILASQTLYHYAVKSGHWFGKSLGYAFKGVLTTLAIGVIVAPLYALSQIPQESQVLAGKIVGGLILAYLGLVVLGYIGEKVWVLLNKRHHEATGQSLAQRFKSDTEDQA